MTIFGTPTDTLARTIYGEARGQGVSGMTAVAAVILNRAKNPGWWGYDVASVCTKPKQFSCRNPGDPNLEKLEAADESDPAFRQAIAIAQSAMQGNLIDPTNGATSYYDDSIAPPYWAKDRDPCAIIGHLIFFKDA
jgi:N-acetylmuramoyl-L-alanine amidase